MNKSYIRLLVAVALVVVLLFTVDFTQVGDFFANLTAVSLLMVFLISFVLIFISTYKWKIFLNHFNLPSRLHRLLCFYVMGYFFNHFLPSNFGGDAVRFLFTSRGKGTYSDSFVSVFMERFTGLVGLLVLMIFAFPVAVYQYDFKVAFQYLLPTIGVILACMALVIFVNRSFLERFSFSNRFLSKLHEKLLRVVTAVHSFRDHKDLLVQALLLSVLFNLMAVINVYIAAWALGVTTNLYSLFVFVPIIMIISAVPLSINGIGIVEGAYVLCLTAAGVSPSGALSIALLMRGKSIVIGMLGGILFALYRNEVKVEAESKV